MACERFWIHFERYKSRAGTPYKVVSQPFGLAMFLDPDSGSDFKLDKFLSAPCETFDPHYGNLPCVQIGYITMWNFLRDLHY